MNYIKFLFITLAVTFTAHIAVAQRPIRLRVRPEVLPDSIDLT